MTTTKPEKDTLMHAALTDLLRLRRDEATPYRLRCVQCGKILGEIGEGASATLLCATCLRLTMGTVTDGRLVLLDMGPVKK